MVNNDPTTQFITSLDTALAYFQQLEKSGDISLLDQERQNLNQVIGMGLSRPETRIAALVALKDSFELVYVRGYWQEGVDTFAKALALCPDDRPDLKVDLFGHYGQLLRISGQLSASATAHESELALAKELDNPLLIGRAHGRLAHIYREMLNLGPAEEHGQAALVELEKTDDEGIFYKYNVLNALGRIAGHRANFTQALAYLSRAVNICREHHQDVYLAECLHDLGRIYEQMGQPAQAMICFEEADQLLEGTEHILKRIYLLIDTGVLYFNLQDYVRAETIFRSIDLNYLRQNGHLDQEACLLTNIGNSVLYQQRYAEAAHLHGRAIPLWQQLEQPLDLANAVGSLGEALAGQGKKEQAITCFQEALHILEPYADLPRGKRLITLFTTELQKIQPVEQP